MSTYAAWACAILQGTEAVVAASVSLETPLASMQDQHPLFLACKSQLRGHIAKHASRVTPACDVLPAVVGSAPEDVRTAAGQVAAPPTGVSVAGILARAKLIPKRNTHRSVRKSAPTEAPAERTYGSAADLLRVVLQHVFPATGASPALETRSFLGFPQAASQQRPSTPLLALEDDPSRQQQPQAVTVAPLPDVATAAAEENPADPAAVVQQQRALREEAALGAQDDEPALKRPACGPGKRPPAVSKRPAAVVRKADLKKKSAAAVSKKTWPSDAQRLRLQPNGCGKCRGRKGCCDSCWVYRGYERP